jgi:hypothetical protein
MATRENRASEVLDCTVHNAAVLRPTERNIISIEEACHLVAEHYHGKHGHWVYKAFDWINATLFAGELPCPLIVLGLTPHGGCVGWTQSSVTKPPTIMLHPSIWGGTEREDPWGISPDILGARYALDVLIHECMHVKVNYLLGGPSAGDSSHNNPEWIAEVNRIAPLIGLSDVQAARSIVKREGKKTRRVCEGNIPLKAAATFPYAVRKLRGELGYYHDRSELSFERDVQLGVTPVSVA